jgi:hypothetical protein|tara:strand:+ start:943 stop:1164 length:222 start_codon:yes stop_codon:yes gene_type:complete
MHLNLNKQRPVEMRQIDPMMDEFLPPALESEQEFKDFIERLNAETAASLGLPVALIMKPRPTPSITPTPDHES